MLPSVAFSCWSVNDASDLCSLWWRICWLVVQWNKWCVASSVYQRLCKSRCFIGITGFFLFFWVLIRFSSNRRQQLGHHLTAQSHKQAFKKSHSFVGSNICCFSRNVWSVGTDLQEESGLTAGWTSWHELIPEQFAWSLQTSDGSEPEVTWPTSTQENPTQVCCA